LVTYGTLAPGGSSHHLLAALRGTWRSCTITGRFDARGWGLTGGFPGLVWDPDGPAMAAHLLESPDLPAHWARLDAFEGGAYQREVVPVDTDTGQVMATAYTVRVR